MSDLAEARAAKVARSPAVGLMKKAYVISADWEPSVIDILLPMGR